jgi:hypothetical protein
MKCLSTAVFERKFSDESRDARLSGRSGALLWQLAERPEPVISISVNTTLLAAQFRAQQTTAVCHALFITIPGIVLIAAPRNFHWLELTVRHTLQVDYFFRAMLENISLASLGDGDLFAGLHIAHGYGSDFVGIGNSLQNVFEHEDFLLI